MSVQSVPECFVCRKQRGELSPPGGPLYCDELVYASHAFIPEGAEMVYRGWVIVEPRRHVPELADLHDNEAAAIGVLTSHLSKALMVITRAEHIYVFILGHGVSHLHIHLVPRYPGTPREYRV